MAVRAGQQPARVPLRRRAPDRERACLRRWPGRRDTADHHDREHGDRRRRGRRLRGAQLRRLRRLGRGRRRQGGPDSQRCLGRAGHGRRRARHGGRHRPPCGSPRQVGCRAERGPVRRDLDLGGRQRRGAPRRALWLRRCPDLRRRLRASVRGRGLCHQRRRLRAAGRRPRLRPAGR